MRPHGSETPNGKAHDSLPHHVVEIPRWIYPPSRSGLCNFGCLSRRKLLIEIPMAADPDPDPHIIGQSLCDGAIVSRYSHRPETRIGA